MTVLVADICEGCGQLLVPGAECPTCSTPARESAQPQARLFEPAPEQLAGQLPIGGTDADTR